MKIFLIGNYVNDHQKSMLHFAEMLKKGLISSGCEVELIVPQVFFGKFKTPTYLSKWLGYLDKYLVFPIRLKLIARALDKKTVIHICDHSNAVYGKHFLSYFWGVTCHDLLAVRSARGEFSENPTRWSGKILQKWILSSIARAPYIACVSESTRNDLAKLLPQKESVTSIIENGLNEPFRVVAQPELKSALKRIFSTASLNLPDSFILHVGSDSWYKNRQFVLKLFASLIRKTGRNDLKLVCIGRNATNWLRQIKCYGIADHVYFFESIASSDLNALYSGAECLLFPSLAEGFGWPIIEAMACGCRVLTSNVPPMSQISGDVAYLIDPRDCVSATQTLEKVLNESPDEKKKRIQAGLERVLAFSTDSMVAKYLALFQKISAKVSV